MDYLRSLPIEYIEHERRAAVHHVSAGSSRGVDITYPFENGIGELPLTDKVACVLGYLEASTTQLPYANFQEWITNRLGRGIAVQFMLPYNQKIWDCPLDEISLGLVANKIHPAPLKRLSGLPWVRKSPAANTGRALIYPRDGLNTLTAAMAAPVQAHIRLGFHVAAIHASGAGYEIVSTEGARVACQAVISTLPLPRLGRLLAPGDWPQPDWRHNNTRFLIVGLNRAPDSPLHWQFFADPRFPFYRLTYMHNFSDRFPPAWWPRPPIAASRCGRPNLWRLWPRLGLTGMGGSHPGRTAGIHLSDPHPALGRREARCDRRV